METVDDTDEFQITVSRQAFKGISMPTAALFYYYPLTAAEYDRIAGWGCDSIYIRLWWGQSIDNTGIEPDELTPGDPVTGAGYYQPNIVRIQNQIALAQSKGLYVWLGLQDVWKFGCPPNSTVGWQDVYGSDFINLNTQPERQSYTYGGTSCTPTGQLTPMPGRQRFINLLTFLCKTFPTTVGIAPWDFPYHSGTISSAARTQFYAYPTGTQALLIQAIRNADATYHPDDPPRLVCAPTLQQGCTTCSTGTCIPTGELANTHFYDPGPPWYGENIYYSFNSHDGGYTWAPKTSCWGFICRAANPDDGKNPHEITEWDYDSVQPGAFNQNWSGITNFKAAHPTAKFMCYEWVGLVNQYSTVPGANDRPIRPSRLAWMHHLYTKARDTGNVSVFYFNWWGRMSNCVESPTDNSGGVIISENQVGRIIRYNNTLCDASHPNAQQWSDGSWHTIQQPYFGGVPPDWLIL